MLGFVMHVSKATLVEKVLASPRILTLSTTGFCHERIGSWHKTT